MQVVFAAGLGDSLGRVANCALCELEIELRCRHSPSWIFESAHACATAEYTSSETEAPDSLQRKTRAAHRMADIPDFAHNKLGAHDEAAAIERTGQMAKGDARHGS